MSTVARPADATDFNKASGRLELIYATPAVPHSALPLQRWREVKYKLVQTIKTIAMGTKTVKGKRKKKSIKYRVYTVKGALHGQILTTRADHRVIQKKTEALSTSPGSISGTRRDEIQA